jgi:hypothetical protein
MDASIERWRSWSSMHYPSRQYPPGSDDGTVEGIDLALVDGDVGKILRDYFEHGQVADHDLAMLSYAIGV